MNNFEATKDDDNDNTFSEWKCLILGILSFLFFTFVVAVWNNIKNINWKHKNNAYGLVLFWLL